jgi:Holliday junction resolvasome RuvABC endonuclease subunit
VTPREFLSQLSPSPEVLPAPGQWTVVGVDPGLTAAGACIWAGEEVDGVLRGRVVWVNAWSPRQGGPRRCRTTRTDDLARRYQSHARWLDGVLALASECYHGRLLCVAVEALAIPHRTSRVTVSTLGRSRGLVDALAVAHRVELVDVQAKAAKAAATGYTGAAKTEVQDAVEARWCTLGHVHPPSRREHAADAVAVLLSAGPAVVRVAQTLGRDVERFEVLERSET